VNDDFCDCGNDEPATSACSSSGSKPAVFLCTNGGFQPQLLPLSRINDGIVDCCDCSDEPTLLDCIPQTGCAKLREEVERKRNAKVLVLREGRAAFERLVPPLEILHALRIELDVLSNRSDSLAQERQSVQDKLKVLEKSLERRQEAAKEESVQALAALVPKASVDILLPSQTKITTTTSSTKAKKSTNKRKQSNVGRIAPLGYSTVQIRSGESCQGNQTKPVAIAASGANRRNPSFGRGPSGRFAAIFADLC